MKKNKEFASGGRLLFSVAVCALVVLLPGCGQKNDIVYSLSGSSVAAESAQNLGEAEVKADAGDAAGSEVTISETKDSGEAENTDRGTVPDTSVQVPADREMYIYVCGAVHVPGVYQLPAGSRAYQAIAAAGGMTDEAYERSLNQAEELSDGQQITIFTKEEAEKLGLDQKLAASGAAEASAGGSTAGGDGNAACGDASSGVKKVNLNTATKEELMTIPGVGEAKASAILQYREENGSFSSIEEVQNISGIKAKAFSKMKDYIEV